MTTKRAKRLAAKIIDHAGSVHELAAAIDDAEKAEIATSQRAGIAAARAKQKVVKQLDRDGATADKIAEELEITVATVKRMLKAPAGSCHWGGRDSRVGRTKADPSAALELHDKGRSYAEIGRLFGISRNTAYRYCRAERSK